jgi:glycosyltransferase involved in cell wall biosynthesis
MATGRPILCLNLGGPGVQVTDEIGIKVAAHSPEQATQDIATAMVELASNASLRQQMGLAGVQLVRKSYSWEARGQMLIELYDKLTAPAIAKASATPTTTFPNQ